MNREEHLEKIKEADTAYYDDVNSIMSDQEYDILRATYIARYGEEEEKLLKEQLESDTGGEREYSVGDYVSYYEYDILTMTDLVEE